MWCLVATLLIFYQERYKEQNTQPSFASPALRIQNMSWCCLATGPVERTIFRFGCIRTTERNGHRTWISVPWFAAFTISHVLCMYGGVEAEAGTCRGMVYTSHVSLAWLHFSLCSPSHPNVAFLTQQPVWKQFCSSTCILSIFTWMCGRFSPDTATEWLSLLLRGVSGFKSWSGYWVTWLWRSWFSLVPPRKCLEVVPHVRPWPLCFTPCLMRYLLAILSFDAVLSAPLKQSLSTPLITEYNVFQMSQFSRSEGLKVNNVIPKLLIMK